MRSTVVDPPIRTLTRIDYDEYLRSASWRITRNHALRQAGYRCGRCGANRNVQVHHKTYERLGREWDGDLEVVCKECHEQVHIKKMEDDTHGRLYLRIASDVVRQEPSRSIADLSDAVKTRCATLKIPYDRHQVDLALGLLTSTDRLNLTPASHPELFARPARRGDERPFSRDEAVRIWEELETQGIYLSRVKPAPKPCVYLPYVAPNRKPFEERLAEVYVEGAPVRNKAIKERMARNRALGQQDAARRCNFCRRELPRAGAVVVALTGQRFCNDDCLADAEERDRLVRR